MKNLTLLAITLFIASLSFSQDVITKTDGTEIEAIVLKVSDDEIEYRKFDNQEGPIYSVSRDKVFMINYSNGSKDVFPIDNLQDTVKVESSSIDEEELVYHRGVWYKGKKINTKQIRELYSDYPDALKEYNKSKALMGLSIPMAFVGGGLLGYSLAYSAFEGPVPIGFWITGGVFTTLGIIAGAAADGKVKSSVKIYNRALKYSNSTSYIDVKFGLTQYGIGVNLRF
ncbi:MAG: hypothetical protein KQH67_13065 [Bacteroidetes bacterium]|nr:hypothetical protein [Bacteroidota bacterium]